MSSDRFDPLDPTVPLETVEQWIATPPQPALPAPVTEYVSTPVYAPPLVQEPLGQEQSVQEPLGQEPLVPEPLGQEPVLSEPILTAPLLTAPVANALPATVIEPMRSPGIVLPEPPQPSAGTEAGVTEAEEAEAEIEAEKTPWTKHLLPWALLVLAVLICLIALAQLVPGWWSNFIAGLVDGYSGRGAGWGAGIGFLFTYLATLMIGHAVHKWASWKAPVALVVGGLVVAAPNLFTLWINHGPTTAARNANALLDRTAPLFRGASLAGAAAGLALGILTTVLYRMWRKRTRRIKAMESLVDDYA